MVVMLLDKIVFCSFYKENYIYEVTLASTLLCLAVCECFNIQVVSKEMAIQEKEKLYIDLKQILARQPGPEVAEQLQIYQQSLKEKTKQMKVN